MEPAPVSVTEAHYWGQVETHGVNGIAAQKVDARWSKPAALEGRLPHEEEAGELHAIAQQSDHQMHATQGQAAEYWGAADDKARVKHRTQDSSRAGERGCMFNSSADLQRH